MTDRTADILEAIVGHLKAMSPEMDFDGLSTDTHIVDAGVDSLKTLELLVRLEDSFDVKLPDEKMAGVRTFGDLAAVVGQ